MDRKNRIKSWALTLILILSFAGSGAIAVFNLRQNNLNMLTLREEVFVADRDNGDVTTALSKLQTYIVSHMNTALPKLGDEKAIQLKYTYERKVAEEEARIASERTALNSEATEYCQKTFSTSSFAVRSQCVQDYFSTHPITETSIPIELYSYDFITPLWTPDVAGLSLLATSIIGVFLVVRLIGWIAVRRMLAKNRAGI